MDGYSILASDYRIAQASPASQAVVRLHGEGDACSVMLPTAGRISPNLETGLTADAIEAGHAIEVDGVPFEQVQALVRALRSEFGAECGLAGWTEFRASPEGWKRGTVTWRVRSLPAALPESITVDETPAPAAVAIAADGPEPLASRRFSIHWPRWRRQDS